MEIGSKISEYRKQKGLTQRELADHVGVTETTIANWEKNRSGVDWIVKVARLCRILDCHLNDLFDEEPEPTAEELRAMYRESKAPKKSFKL